MFIFAILSVVALTVAEASILPCGSGLSLPGYPVVSGVSSYPLGERVIANNCRCTKTIVRPQVNQCLINVPTTRRLVQNSISNVVENIPYRTGCGASLDVCNTPGFGSLAPLGALAGYGLGCAAVGAAPLANLPYAAAPLIDAVAPVNSVLGCGASLDGYISPLIGAGVPFGAVNGCGLGYSGLNDAVLGGDVVAPIVGAGCAY